MQEWEALQHETSAFHFVGFIGLPLKLVCVFSGNGANILLYLDEDLPTLEERNVEQMYDHTLYHAVTSFLTSSQSVSIFAANYEIINFLAALLS